MSAPNAADLLVSAGLPSRVVADWIAAEPARISDFPGDRRAYGTFWTEGVRLISALPKKPARSDAERGAAEAIFAVTRAARDRFLAAHARAVYDELTEIRSRFVRLEELVYQAAEAVPGLVPSRHEVAAEAALDQRDKDGVEIDQGLFVSRVLADERAGLHLCHAMLLPREESAEPAARFAAEGAIDLGVVRLERRGRATHLIAVNPRFLNAEDDTTLDAMEIATDVAILDPASEIIVMRGGPVEHPKYRDRPIFGAGINLTHLYRGAIPYLWFPRRELGYVHKIFRGVARPDALPDDVSGFGIEKPWVAAVDTFAIGGHCQILLVMDYVIAAADAFMTLPARKEGIIPGLANLRLPRFVGDRIARQAIQYERRLPCNSPEGRLICDEIVAPQDVAASIERVIAGLTSAGSVGAIGNRRALRIGEEPIDIFRRYAALYAREQAFCHFSPALIANLERNWDAQNRKL
jgi:(3,5-dihydroxyphenyl)acetyl-CoA 1,2-dioxygenase